MDHRVDRRPLVRRLFRVLAAARTERYIAPTASKALAVLRHGLLGTQPRPGQAILHHIHVCCQPESRVREAHRRDAREEGFRTKDDRCHRLFWHWVDTTLPETTVATVRPWYMLHERRVR